MHSNTLCKFKSYYSVLITACYYYYCYYCKYQENMSLRCLRNVFLDAACIKVDEYFIGENEMRLNTEICSTAHVVPTKHFFNIL